MQTRKLNFYTVIKKHIKDNFTLYYTVGEPMFLRWRSVSCTLSATERSLGRETAQSECTFNTDHDFIFLNITLQ